MNLDVLSSMFFGDFRPYFPASSLRGNLRQALTSLIDNTALYELNNSQVVLSAQIGSGKTRFFSQVGYGKTLSFVSVVVNRFLLSEWKQTPQKLWAMWFNQEIASRPVFKVFKEEATSYTSTHIAYPDLTLEINPLSFAEDNPHRQRLTQCSNRTASREANKRYLSDFLLFTYVPIQCFMHKCKQIPEEDEFFSFQEINKKLSNEKDVRDVRLPNCNFTFIRLINFLKGIETQKSFQFYPIFHREVLSLYFFIDSIPDRGLKRLFAINNYKFRFWKEILGFFADAGLRFNKFSTINYLKLINFSRFRGQTKNINFTKDITKYSSSLKEEIRQLLRNKSNLFGLKKINIIRFVSNLLLINKLLFRRFLIDKRCDFIFLVEMPP